MSELKLSDCTATCADGTVVLQPSATWDTYYSIELTSGDLETLNGLKPRQPSYDELAKLVMSMNSNDFDWYSPDNTVVKQVINTAEVLQELTK